MRIDEVDDRVRDLIWTVIVGSTESLRPYHPSLAKALVYIADHVQEKISLPELSSRACTSEAHLRRLFREELGLSPRHFLALLRVERSKLLMMDRQLSITDVCFRSGFTNLRSFERTFKRWTGCTPKQYRMKLWQQRRR